MKEKALRNEKEFVRGTVNGYLKKSDWRVKENSNVGFSVGGLILHNSGALTANYWLDEVYTEEIREAHKSASLHLHDLSMLSVYCCGWSIKQLIMEGLGGVPDKISSAPAKHLSTLVQQLVNFLGIMQNEAAGAQAFSSFDTYLAPFIKADNLTDKEVRQCMQTFIFGINTPSRWGTQAPFSNVTLDWICPADLAWMPAIVGGKDAGFTYGDCQKEMDTINRIFIDVLLEGDAAGRGFQYPIPTYNITKEFDWDHPNAEKLFSMTAKYGTPYFQNFINSDLNPSDVRSMCCRLSLDKRELRKRGGGLFGSDEFTGSVGVVTINLPQIAHLSVGETGFFSRLHKQMEIAKDSLEIKRNAITSYMEQGLYPYMRRYLRDFNNYFSTIGLVGMNEACINFLGKDITTKEGAEFAERVLVYMRDVLVAFQEETGNLYNLEATPAESTSYRLAKHDTANYPDIITSGEAAPYYTNSSQLPVGYTQDVFEALDMQEPLQIKYTGGTVFHMFLGEAITDWKSCRELIRNTTRAYKIPYFTVSPTYSICAEHGYLVGSQKQCPVCGKTTEVYDRIVGYYRSTNNWNEGKSAEHVERVPFVVDKA